MKFDDEIDEYSESIEYIPDKSVEMDSLPAEFVPEIPDEKRKDATPPTVDSSAGEQEDKPPVEEKKEGEETDEVPDVDLESIKAELEETKKAKEKAEARAGYWQRQAEKKANEQKVAESEEPKPLEKPVKPKQEDFADFDQYEAEKDKYYEDLADYKVALALRAQEEKKQEAAKQANVQELDEWKGQMIADGVATFPDFEEITFDPIVPITMDVLKAVQACTKDEVVSHAEIVYYLGKNIREAAKISRMTPDAMGREIGAIAEKIAADKAKVESPPPEPKPEPKKISSAPPPITPVRGTSTVVTKNPEKMTNKEYRAWRMAGGK